MSDLNNIDSELEIELNEDDQKILFYALDDAKNKLIKEGAFSPFSIILAGEDLFFDTYSSADVDACFEASAEAVNAIAHIADSYVFCYDGYIDTDDGQKDMLIAEVGRKYEEHGNAFGLIYKSDPVEFEDVLIALGEVDNLFDPEQVETAEFIRDAYAEGSEIDLPETSF